MCCTTPAPDTPSVSTAYLSKLLKKSDGVPEKTHSRLLMAGSARKHKCSAATILKHSQYDPDALSVCPYDRMEGVCVRA